MKLLRYGLLLLLCAFVAAPSAARRRRSSGDRRQIGLAYYTFETEHFRIHFHEGVEDVARRVGVMLEEFYSIYTKTYFISLPKKTEVLVSSDEQNFDNFASNNANLISISANDFGYNLRGSGNYLRDAVAHEFAHIMSMSTAQKGPAWMPYAQFGAFSHPNEGGLRSESFHLFPFDNLPPWFFEGIAQFESSRMGGDRWDSHRDMILRTLTMSDKLLTWDHMSVFAGRGDDYEKTYNHGFSLIRYIVETYGQGAVVSLLRENTKMFRLTFDRSVKQVLGISARQLYRDWKKWLEVRYKAQVDSIGTQVYGRKINKHGFDNLWPRFVPDQNCIFFLSNGESEYSWGKHKFYRYYVADTVEDDERIEPMGPAPSGPYDIHDSLGLMVQATMASPESNLPWKEGGWRLMDLKLDTLVKKEPGERVRRRTTRSFYKAHEDPITKRQSLFAAAFSPTGNRLAAAQHHVDRFYLCVLDTSGGNLVRVYPQESDSERVIQTIYSLDWSPDGHQIAMSFVEHEGDRKIGIYDTTDHSFTLLCDTKFDERDPRFNADGSRLYFSSNRTGIYNIYRFELATGALDRVTNVAGGAFSPDVSPDGTSLVYVNYDSAGYGIYLIDTMTVVESDTGKLCRRPPPEPPKPSTVVFSKPVRYSRGLRQFIMVPTLLYEEIVSENDDAFEGDGATKVGIVANLFDPFSWSRGGNSLGGYFLIDPGDLPNFLDDEVLLDPANVNYDMGAFFTTTVFPFELSAQYLHRGVGGTERFYVHASNYVGWHTLEYGLTPRRVDLQFTQRLKKYINHNINLHAVGSYTWYTIYLDIPSIPRSNFDYDAARGYRLGLFATAMKSDRDPRSFISPRGAALKLAYDFHDERLQNEEERFEDDGWTVKYDEYRYHQLSAGGRYGKAVPFLKKHHLYLEGWGTTVQLTNSTKKQLRDDGTDPRLTPFFEPVGWLPGYTYYYRDTVPRADLTGVSADSVVDSVLISGSTVMQFHAAYRFPLWPKPIDRKLGWIYFEHVYGAVNMHAGAGFMNASDLFKWRRNDWLTSVGLELRLDATTFNRYPLAFSFRWDRGLDRDKPIGGDRFTIGLGFNFDDWSLLDYPDYLRTPGERMWGGVGMR